MLLVAIWWVVGWALCFRVPLLPAADPVGPMETAARAVAVVVPAHDEADSLPALLAGLARQTQPATEIVVVDDESADGTAALATAAGARVVPVVRPDGWTGKAWACDRGAAAAGADVLVFLDADTRPAPDLLERLEAQRVRSGGLVSVQPYHRMARPVRAAVGVLQPDRGHGHWHRVGASTRSDRRCVRAVPFARPRDLQACRRPRRRARRRARRREPGDHASAPRAHRSGASAAAV